MGLFSLWGSVTLLTGLFILYKISAFSRNIRLAKATGLPYVLSPFNELESICYITGALFRWKYSQYLERGEGWPRWARFMIKDWPYEDKGRAHEEYGDVFLVVSPGGLVCYIADAKVAMDVCKRPKDFVKEKEKMKMLEPFGPNIVTVEGDLWRLHQRITLPPFGEAVNKLVWSEAYRQTDFLISAWAKNGSGDLKTDVYHLGLNVISAAGFGRQLEWTDDSKPPAGHAMNLIESILGVVLYLPQILLLPKLVLKYSPWGNAYRAYTEFERYMREFIAVEKDRIEQNAEYESKMRGNLLTSILKTNANVKKEQERLKEGRPLTTKDRMTFNDDEVLGNIFMFFMAGYDTTANTMMYYAVILALYDEIQDELIREVDHVYDVAKEAGRTDLTYTDDFPKFRYALALMYEILRVFPIVIPLTREVEGGEQRLCIESDNSGTSIRKQPAERAVAGNVSVHVLPEPCGVVVNNTGIHYNTKYWSEPHAIDPHRWLSENPNQSTPRKGTHAFASKPHDPLAPMQTNGPIPTHVKGTFMTFAEGPRACLGRRFAQAELIAFFSRLLRHYRIRLGEGVSRQSVEQTMRLRSAGSPVTLALPEDVKLYLTPRHR